MTETPPISSPQSASPQPSATGYESVLNRSDLPSTARIRIPMSDVELHERRAERRGAKSWPTGAARLEPPKIEARYRSLRRDRPVPEQEIRSSPRAQLRPWSARRSDAPYSGELLRRSNCPFVVIKVGSLITLRTTFARWPNPFSTPPSPRRGTPDKRRRRSPPEKPESRPTELRRTASGNISGFVWGNEAAI